MLRRGYAVHFERLGHLPCAHDECLGETALARWRVEPIRDEKRVLRELGSPSDDSRHECRMQLLLRTRSRGIVGIDGSILGHVHV